MKDPHAWSNRLWLRTTMTLAMAAAIAPGAVCAKENKRKAAADARPFIEESLIVAPRQVGEFELEGSRYDPAHKYAGVALRYRLSSHPEMRIDLFVYPAGSMSEQDAIKAGMEPFLATFEEGVRQGYYDRFELLRRGSFEIEPQPVSPTPAADGDAPPSPAKEKATGDDDADRIETLLSAVRPLPIRGERLDLRYRMPMGFEEPVPMRSRGYLFYKQLYYFKGRLTATEAAIGQVEFDALTDRAMRELIPAIRAHNVGACAERVISLDPGLLDANQTDQALDDAIAHVMAESFAQTGRSNCHQTRAEAEEAAAPDAETVVISFDPEDWSGE